MANTSVDLGNHFTDFVRQLKQNGRYGSVSEAVRAGLRLLEEDETRLEAIKQELIAGEESGESELTVDYIWQEVKARVDAE